MTQDFWNQFEAVEDAPKTKQSNDFWGQFEEEQPQQQYTKPKGDKGWEISAYKPPSAIDKLKQCLQWVIDTPRLAYTEGKQNVELAELETKDMFLGLSVDEKKRLAALEEYEGRSFGIPEVKYADENISNLGERVGTFFKKGYAEAFRMLPMTVETLKSGGLGYGVGGAVGAGIALVGGQLGPQAATPEEVVTVPAMAMAGAKLGGGWGGRLGAAKKVFELEAGFARNELKQIVDEEGKPLDPVALNGLSIGVGGVNAALELYGLKLMLKTIPNGDKILNKVTKESVKDLATNPTVKQALTEVAIKYGQAVGGETSTEMAQEMTVIVASEIAKKLKGVDNTPIEKNVARVLETGISTLGAMIYTGGVGSTAQTVNILIKDGKSKAEAQKIALNMSSEEKQEFVAENFEKLVPDSQNVKFAEDMKPLEGSVTYNKYKDELVRQGSEEQLADQSAQLIEQAHRVIADKFGEEGIEHLKNSNLQVLINKNNEAQIKKEEQFIDTDLSKRDSQQFTPEELETDAKTFQYKENSDTEGVTERLQGVEKFDPLFAGKVIVYENKEGQKFIVDGHQRLGLAKRLSDENIKLEGYLFKEKDGYTPEQVRVLAAQKNIAEGSGTSVDTAKIIKEIGIEKLPKSLPTKSAMVQDGIALSRLGDEAFQKVINEEITSAQGARIADAIRTDEIKQSLAVDAVKNAKLDNLEQVYMLAREIAMADTTQSEQVNLFGTQEIFNTTAIEKIKIVDRTVKSLKTDKKIFSSLIRNQGKIQEKGKNKLDKKTNEEIKQEAAVAINLIEKLASMKGNISDKANELAKAVKEEQITMSEAVNQFREFATSKQTLKEIWGKAKNEIKYNQEAIQKALEGLEEESKLAVDKEKSEQEKASLRKKYNEEYGGAFQAALFNVDSFKDGQQTLFDPLEFYQKGLYQASNTEITKSAAFKEWFGGSKVVDEDGKPLVVYHGSVKTFEAFDKDKASNEGDMGAGFYFTDNEYDADDNYHDGGADFDNKVARLAEQIADEEELDYEEAKTKAEGQLRGEPAQYSVYLKMENPVYLGDNQTYLFADVKENIDITEEDYETEEEFYEAQDEALNNEIENLYYSIEQAISDVIEYDKVQEVLGVISEVIYDGGISLQDFKDKLNDLYLENYETGDFVANEIARRIVEELGYDGIIDSTVSEKFNMNIEDGTSHYIVFQPTQIKEVDNKGTFNPNDANIYNQSQEGNTSPRGQFRIDENGTAIIDVLENGDASTVVHELAHFYLYSVETLAQKNKRAESELKEIYNYLGRLEGQEYTEAEIVDFHEKFARGFEAYLLEGSAPTKKMLKVFQNFKSWLKDIYKSLNDLDVDFSETSVRLFDRIFTTDEEYEKEVLPKYQHNYTRTLEIQKAKNEPMYKLKEALHNGKNLISAWYDKLIIPIDSRLGKLSPELQQKLKNHTATFAAITGKELKVATEFLEAVKDLKKNDEEDYYKLDLALKNRDSHTVNILCVKYGFKDKFEAIRDILDDIYSEALEVGLDVGYLENYYPRKVKTELSDKFIEYIEALARKEDGDIKNRILKLEDAKISLVLREMKDANNSEFWTQEDKAKFINNRIRGFGRNNILLARNGSLKFDRSIDELDGDFNQYYEPMEAALISYISGSRKTIEARKFFGSENKEVGKLRATIKRKKATLDEVKNRTPSEAKYKEINRLKYELSPIEIKLESVKKQDYKTEATKEYMAKLETKIERLKSQIEWVEEANSFQVKGVVIKRLKDEITEAAKKITDIIGDEDNINDSIGQLVNTLALSGDIIAKDERAIRDMLEARFSAKNISDPVRLIRDFTYIATLNDITNAITQFGDLAFSVYKYGFENSFKGIMKPFGIRKEDLGLNDMAYEFSNPSRLSKWIKKQFEWIGLSKIDGLGKNAIIQASILDAQKKIQKNDKAFDEKLQRIFGNEIEKVKKELLAGETTDNTIIFAFEELAEIQPISEDQTPELYQSGSGFMKLFYTLKTYGIKALDIARTDITTKIEQGIKTKDKKMTQEGLRNLVRLQMLLWLFGVPIDTLKDLLSNRDINLFESIIDTLIPAFLVNRYMFRTADREGVGSAVVDFFTPAVANVIESTGKSYSISNIPFIGKPLYNWGIKERK